MYSKFNKMSPYVRLRNIACLCFIFNGYFCICTETLEEFPDCDNYGHVYPLNDNVSDDCSMEINKADMEQVLYQFKKTDFHINLLKIRFDFPHDVHVNKTNCTVVPLEWMWTYKGKNGGFQYLFMMKEFSMYSLGILDHNTYSVNLRVNVYGGCPVIIGKKKTTERLALAILQTFNTTSLTDTYLDIRYGYICYMSRTYISEGFYSLAKYIINSEQSLGYRCCHNFLNDSTGRDSILCRSKPILIDRVLWWNFPYFMGWVLFVFVPLGILKLLCTEDTTIIKNKKKNDPTDWLTSNSISIKNVLNREKHRLHSRGRVISSIFKIFAVIISSSFVIIEILAYYIFLKDFVVDITKSDVPFNWINMAAGYQLSKDTFLPFFGGPYIALSLYFISSSLLLCLPSNLGTFVERGLEESSGLFTTLVTVDITTKGKLGAVFNIHRERGFNRYCSVLKAHLYMLINPSFWKLGLHLQIERCIGYVSVTSRNRILFKMLLAICLLFPYIVICAFEWITAIVLYGCPIVGFYFVLIRACYFGMKRSLPKSGISKFVVVLSVNLFMSVCVAFDIYIFSLLFIASFIFLCRICTYTFTGLIAYPDITYGYIVFTITVVIYVTESIQRVNTVYGRLFKQLINICKKNKTNPSYQNVPLINHEKSVISLSSHLFHYVIRYLRPLRVEIVFSVLKIILIVIILYMSISTLLAFKEMSKMPALTQAVTAVFICLIPKLWHLLTKQGEHPNDSKETVELERIMDMYIRSYIRKHNTIIIHLQHSYSELDNSEEDENQIEQCSEEEELTDELLLDIDIE